MCQGVIVSVVEWRGKNRKIKRCVLSGIGSHSQLLANNAKRLNRLGWRENSTYQHVYSIESDFSAWNKFQLAGDEPDGATLRLLKNEYKRIAGNAKALIAHVKRCGKIDDALLNLLTAPALAEYDKVTAPALAEYDKVKAAAWAEYDKVTAATWCKLFAVKSNRVEHLR